MRLRQEIASKNKLLEFLASHDPLTKLPNRRNYYRSLNVAAKRAQRGKHKVALLIIDLNGFKQINDSYGHNAGDLLLLNIATRLRLSVRQTDTIARIGGDEFAVILDDVHDDQEIYQIVSKLTDAIAEPAILQNSIVTVAASVCVAIYPEHEQDMKKLQEKADQAMYYAKQKKQNCVIWKASFETESTS